MKPIILQMRRAPEFRDLTSGTESAFLRKKWYYGVDWRGFVAWGKNKLPLLLKFRENLLGLFQKTILSEALII